MLRPPSFTHLGTHLDPLHVHYYLNWSCDRLTCDRLKGEKPDSDRVVQLGVED